MLIYVPIILQLFTFPVLQQFGLLFKERLETIGLTSAEITTIINLNPCITSCSGESKIYGIYFNIRSMRCDCFSMTNSHSPYDLIDFNALHIRFRIGLLNGPLFRRFTYRQAAIFGASLIVVSLYLTSISNSFTTYVITFSILYGNFIAINKSLDV